MIQHVVNIGKSVVDFKQIDSIIQAKSGGYQIAGQAQTITEFVQGIELNKYTPFGYVLRYVIKTPNTKNFIALLYKLGSEF